MKKVFVFSLIFIVLINNLCFAKTALEVIQENDYPFHKLYAHRGLHHYRWNYPLENSIGAFQDAGKAGYKYIETDIYESIDGVYYCIHDGAIDKCSTMAPGKNIKEMTSEEIDKIDMDICSESYKALGVNFDNHIPKLEEFLSCCTLYNMIPIIEIKDLQNYNERLQNLLEIIEYYTPKYVIISFEGVCSFVKSYRPDALVLLLVGDRKLDDTLIQDCFSKGIGLCVDKKHYTPELSIKSYEAGFPLMFWVVNDYHRDYRDYFEKDPFIWSIGTDNIKPSDIKEIYEKK